MYASASRDSAVVSPDVRTACAVSSQDAATTARPTRRGGGGRLGSTLRTHAATRSNRSSAQLHHPVAVLEALLADGVDLDEEGAAGERPSASPVHEPVGRGGQDLGRASLPDTSSMSARKLLAELVVGGQERVLLAAELLVERRPRDPRGRGDVGHGRRRVAVLADHVEDRVEDPLALGGLDLLAAEAVGSLGEAVGDLTSHVQPWYST